MPARCDAVRDLHGVGKSFPCPEAKRGAEVAEVGERSLDAVDAFANGEFRQDLFYRLHVIELAMPSLREMREDIPSIADALLHKMSRAAPAKLNAEAAAALEEELITAEVLWISIRAGANPSAARRARRVSARSSAVPIEAGLLVPWMP